MKLFYSLFLSVCAGLGLQAQSLSVSSQDFTVVGDAFSTAVLTSHAVIKNETSGPLDIRARRRVVSPNNQLTDANYFCWDVCYGYPADQSFGTVTIGAGQSTNVFSGYVDPNGDGIPLSGDIHYTFWVEGNPNDSVRITVTYQVVTNIGLNDNGAVLGLNIFPNPAQSYVNVDYRLEPGLAYDIRVINLVGKEVFSRKVSRLSGTERVDLSTVPNGVYFVQISSGSKVFVTRKFLKN